MNATNGHDAAVATIERGADATVIRASGEIDMVTAPFLEKAVRQVLTERPKRLVVDLGAVRFLSSAGIAVLMLAQAGGQVDLRVVARDRVVLRPLELVGLAGELAIHPTLESALGD